MGHASMRSGGFVQHLTCNIGELVLQRTDICNIDVKERAELWDSHTNARDRDVRQAAAAVHWKKR